MPFQSSKAFTVFAAAPTQGGRLAALDSLRGLAALAVVAYHYTGGFEEVVGPHSRPVHAFLLGHFGVELFFVISGFVIAWTLERSTSLRAFAVSRIARLYPAYLAALALIGAVLFGLGFNPQHISPFALAPNLAIGLPPLIHQPNLDPSFWTLGLEVVFYTLAAVMTFALPRLPMEAWCLGWLATALAVQAVLADNLQLQLLTCSGFAELFVLGAMTFRLLESNRLRPLTLVTWLAAAVIAFVGVERGHLAVHIRYGVLVIAFTAAVALAAKDWLPPLRLRPLVAVGQASYSLYLIHQILGFCMIAALEKASAPPLVAISVATAVVIGLALVLRVVVEKPGQRLVRDLLGLRKSAPTMPKSAVGATG